MRKKGYSVPVERLVPLVEFLERVYGSVGAASERVGVSPTTLRRIKLHQKEKVTATVALQIVDAVQKLHYGSRTFSTYENAGPPRYASVKEQNEPTTRRWRPAGGKARLK